MEIDKSSEIPIYRQIAREIEAQIRTGALMPGDPLPSERELCTRFVVARGTVNKALDSLRQQGVIDILSNRGRVVASRPSAAAAGSRKDRAVRLIQDLLVHLKALRFSPREARALIDLSLLEEEGRLQRLCVAAVDCNPESLGVYATQLGALAPLEISRLVLDEILHDPRAPQRMAAFDLILTTATHYDELRARLPGLEAKIVRVILAPSQRSIINLAGIGLAQRVGIVSESAAFRQIIIRRLADFSVTPDRIASLLLAEAARLPEFIRDKEILIVPPGAALATDRAVAAAVQSFTERGGRVIPFEYQIERGSLLHVDERIQALLRQRDAPGAES